ncbi:hypothetical protein [Microbacterium sp. bgisy203]|uniref:hypothetical protein n=1 Tax=Microbacterium sp. bgisy203 TaxID=3413799 RepID=UPI003D749A11
MTERAGTLATRYADHWARPLRWIIALTVVGALAGLLPMLASTDSFDVVMPIVLAFGAAGGIAGGLRFFFLPWGDVGDPRLGGDFDDTPIWAGYRGVLRDYLWALALWLVGTLGVSIAVAVIAKDASAIVFLPLLFGFVWSMAYGLAALAVGLLAIPIVTLVRARAARRAGRAINPWWYFMTLYLVVMLTAVASYVILLSLAPQLIGVTGESVVEVLFWSDTADFTLGQTVALWATRVLAVVMLGLMIVAGVIGERRLREVMAMTDEAAR